MEGVPQKKKIILGVFQSLYQENVKEGHKGKWEVAGGTEPQKSNINSYGIDAAFKRNKHSL